MKIKTLRIIALRILIASWAVPLSWVVLFPTFCLMAGAKEAYADIIGFNKFIWNGIEGKS